jgi:aryl-alcohol dehydrogenase-like predicted oxidoreductase
MLKLAFGATGHNSSRLIFGAAALGGGTQERADAVLRQVRDAGINHIDTAASYGDSEVHLASFLKNHRAEFFLATKTGERNGQKAREELERSLSRLGVDSVDLIQLHNLVEDDEWTEAFRPDGAVAALEKARAEGLVRHLGVTGHGLRIPRMHLRSLGEYPFASVLFPVNHALLTIDEYHEDVHELVDTCTAKNVAMQTIKSIARGRFTPGAETGFSWYEPLSDAAAIDRGVRFILSHPHLFLNTSSDTRYLAEIVTAASSEQATVRPSAEELASDRVTHNMTPLFDGKTLERI